MTERQAFIVFGIAIFVTTMVVVRCLLSLGADADTMNLAYAVIMCVAGFGVGGIVTHYHR